MNAIPKSSVDIRVNGGRDGKARITFTTSRNVELWSGIALYQGGRIASERMDVNGMNILCEIAGEESPHVVKLEHPECGKDGRKNYMITLQAREEEGIDRLQRHARLRVLRYHGLEDCQESLVVEKSFSAMLQRILGSVHERAVAACNIELPKCTVTAWPG